MILTSQQIIENATGAIIGCASRNKNITAKQMQYELEEGMIEGWLGVPAIDACNLSQWSSAMAEAIKTIQHLEDLGI
jgi:hypothetical protein